MTINDLRVLESVRFAVRQWDGFAPHGARDWVAIRRLVKAGEARSIGYGECQSCSEPHDCELFVPTAVEEEDL